MKLDFNMSRLVVLLVGCSFGFSAHSQEQKNPFQGNQANPQNEQVKINYVNNGVPQGDVKQNLNPPASAPAMQDQQFQQPEVVPTVDNESSLTLKILNTPASRIRKMNKDVYNKAGIINELPVAAPKAAITTLPASVSPGATPPVIRLFKNRTSSLVLTDTTGATWPIANYEISSLEDFTVKRLDKPAPEGSVLTITPNGSHVSGNMVIFLKGLPTPIILDLVSAQDTVDYRLDLRVQAYGPNARMSHVGLPESMDMSLLSILQGVTPQGARRLKVDSGLAQAWLSSDGKMFLRTKYKIMTPAFEEVTSSPDGTYAYKMIPSPIVSFKHQDKFGEIIIGF